MKNLTHPHFFGALSWMEGLPTLFYDFRYTFGKGRRASDATQGRMSLDTLFYA